MLSAISGIGTNKALNLLNHFKSIKRIVNASKEELIAVEGIGKNLAEEIKKIVDSEF